METIFPTPRPSSVLYGGHYSGKTTLTSANFDAAALASIMVPSESFPKASLVTPDYIKKQQEVCYTGAHHQAGTDAVTQKKQLSLIVSAVSALTTTSQHDDRSMPSPRRRREQPAFIPLPVQVKKTGRSGCEGLASPPLLPLISRIEIVSPPPPSPQRSSNTTTGGAAGGLRLNKFVRRLHDMLKAEKDSGIVEWRRGLLVLFSTDAFAKTILPKYFNTRNFKTFRRQLNYYGFVHVRSFSTTGSSTTALWVNRDLAKEGTDDISSVLQLKRVEPCESAKTAEGRRYRKELAISTVEEDIGVSAKTLQMEHIRTMAIRGEEDAFLRGMPVLLLPGPEDPSIPREVHVPTDSSGSNYNSNEDSEDTNTYASEEENISASAAAANVLLMLSKDSHS